MDFRDDVEFADTKPVVGFLGDEFVLCLGEGAHISEADAVESIV
jgi:hypothetical protein